MSVKTNATGTFDFLLISCSAEHEDRSWGCTMSAARKLDQRMRSAVRSWTNGRLRGGPRPRSKIRLRPEPACLLALRVRLVALEHRADRRIRVVSDDLTAGAVDGRAL